MFELYSTGMALGYVTIAKGKPYPHKKRIDRTVKNAEITAVVHDVQLFMTENHLYDFMLEAHTDKCKPFKKWVTTEILPLINATGGYVEKNMEEEFVENYLSGLSEDTKVMVIKELHDNNEELQAENKRLKEFYDTIINTEGLLPSNLVAKELKIGVKKLYTFLRCKEIMFYKNNINIPYQRFMDQKLFEVKETPCKDGKYRPATYFTYKGLDYVRKLLAKEKLCAE